jgi:predicted LPLAT superfamily acyltransferase
MLAVPFLGAPAAFPTGPLRLAAALGAPVVLCFGIRTGPRRYTVYFEHFADRVALDQGDRAAQTAIWLQRYTSRLEHYCRRYPFNWFNFYDFWNDRPQSSAAPEAPALRRGPLPVPAPGRRSRLSVADR